MDLFKDLKGFLFQLKIWNHAFTGDVLDQSALIAESRSELVPGGAWDKGAVSIILSKVSHGDEDYRPIKEFAALPWVVEHIIRGHEDWPGL